MGATPQIVPITDLRKAHLDVLARLADGPVYLVQRSRPAAVLLSTDQWDQLNERLADLEALVQYLEVKLKLATGETQIEEVDIETLRAEVHGIPA